MSETFKFTVAKLISIGIIFLSSTGYAIVLDWNNVTWTSGSLSASYELDASNPGNDITITITGNTGQFISGRPEITTDFTGGFGSSPSPDNLELWVDFANRSQSITVTVTFNYAAGVNDVNFLLFDVDTGSGGSTKTFIDQIREISAVGTSGSLIAPTITTSANNSKSGSGTNQVVSGTDENSNNSGSGNVNIDFGTNYITSFTFEYGNPSSGVQKNPDSQSIGIYDINYKPKVPEVHPGLFAVLSCSLPILGRVLQRLLTARA
ncbi:MAG: hypothetical protein ACO1QS_01565 [Verrucomicrobiota bacterium]